jgi:hypothetical protein
VLIGDAPVVPQPTLTGLALGRREQVHDHHLGGRPLVQEVESQPDRRCRVAVDRSLKKRLD